MWMIDDRNERGTCICTEGKGSVVRSLGQDSRKTLVVGRSHGRARMVSISPRKRMVAQNIADAPSLLAVMVRLATTVLSGESFDHVSR